MDVDSNWNQKYFKFLFLLSVNFALHLGKPSCKPWQFKFNIGKCLHSAWICDRRGPYENDSDELRTDGALCGMLSYVCAIKVFFL